MTFSYFFFLVSTAFWIWMLVDCLRNEVDKTLWGLVILFFNAPAALAYFILRYLPRNPRLIPVNMGRYTRKQDLWNAEAAARNIGKDHQYVELGNLQLEMGMKEEARQSFQTALEKSPSNQQALWGAGQVALDRKQFEEAKTHLKALIDHNPDFKYGDASAAYGQALLGAGEVDAARAHLEQHVKRWTNPEARITIAELALEKGETEVARIHLETMLHGLRGGPQFHYRNNAHLARKAERMLKRLSQSS